MNELSKKGAQPSRQPKYGVLWNNNFYQGIVTQRNPLRANLGHIEEEFYGTQVCLLDGLNAEVSSKLTLVRRPGSSIYNSQTFPQIDRFYSWHLFNSNTEQTKVIADTASVIYDATGPSTKTTLFTKSVGAGKSSFLSVGNTLYFSDGVDVEKVVGSLLSWTASTSYDQGNFIVDSNGYLQVVIGSQTATITNIVITGGTATLFFDPATQLSIPVGTKLSLAGLTTVPDLNGTTQTVTAVLNGQQVQFASALIQSPHVETGTASTGTGMSGPGPSQPTWAITLGAVTQDLSVGAGASVTATISGGAVTGFTGLIGGSNYTSPPVVAITGGGGLGATATATVSGGQITGVNLVNGGSGFSTPPTVTFISTGAQWENAGLQTENWGIATPVATPLVTQAPAPSSSSWAQNTWYAPLFVIEVTVGGTSYLFQLTSAGTTGTSAPAWDTTTGHITIDNNGAPLVPAQWTCLGTPAWAAATPYAVGDIIEASFSYYITVYTPVQVNVAPPGYPPQWVTEQVATQQQINASCVFQCTTAGTSGTSTPYWTSGIGTTVTETTTAGSGALVSWINQGAFASNAWPGASQNLSLVTQILDSNGNLQQVQAFGETGAGAVPTGGWSTTTGAYTIDNTQTWLNAGPYSAANTGAWIYAYSYVNSVTDTVSTADPQSAPILVSAGNLAVIQGVGSSDPQVDEIYIWRTVQGGSTLFYLDQIPNPGGGKTWIYTDTTPDTGLNELIEAPIDDANDPPPAGISALVYHLERIWGAVNNSVYFSAGPDALVGNGNEAWPPANVFVFPDTVIRMFPSTSGLYVFTTADIYLIQGLGTSSSSFFSTPFTTGIGLSSYDAFAVNGSILFLYTSDNQILTLDPSAGMSEVGFNIGDQFPTSTFTSLQTQLTWHISGSADKGLYVSDYANTWWRMCPTPSPEAGGSCWSPKATIAAGFSSVQSIETASGVHTLLIGPPSGGGPILKRDSTVHADNGAAYNAYAVLGSMVLAQPGQEAHAAFFTADSVAVGTPITLAVQLDEIAPVSSGYFEPLTEYTNDPSQLSPSLSTYAQRFWLSQTQLPALCRHLQVLINWGTDVVKNELLSLSLVGSYESEN
jgi:hypothetical protein